VIDVVVCSAYGEVQDERRVAPCNCGRAGSGTTRRPREIPPATPAWPRPPSDRLPNAPSSIDPHVDAILGGNGRDGGIIVGAALPRANGFPRTRPTLRSIAPRAKPQISGLVTNHHADCVTAGSAVHRSRSPGDVAT